MSKIAPHSRLGKCFRMVLVAALCVAASGMARAQRANPALTRLVRPTPGTRPLGAVLTELARQGNLPLSYSSSLVPVAHLYTQRPGPARPLGVVLREVLATEHLSYGLLDGQLVLWPTRIAAPVGVTSVNGQPTRLTQSPTAQSDTAPAVAAPLAEEAEGVSPAATSRTPVSRPATLAGARASTTSGTTNLAAAPGASHRFPAKKPLARGAKTSAVIATRTDLAGGSKPDKLPPRSLFTPTKRFTTKTNGGTGATSSLRGDQLRAHPNSKAQRAELVGRLTNSPIAAHRLHYQPSQLRRPVDSLTFLRSTPLVVPASGGVGPVMVGLASGLGTVASPVQLSDSVTKPFGLLHPSYLHGEAWVSESLPFNAAVKAGVPRIYLVLGVAVGPTGRESGGVAWGVGLGTAGRLRGRFTPSLDVVQWFVSGDRETIPSSLTQLRPQVGWQLKQGGRWQLVGGPTLNLASARHRGPQAQRWDFGRDQWLWVNQTDNESSLRLWPGVQVGVRF